MDSDPFEPTQRDYSEGKEEQERAGQADGVDNDESGNRTWEGFYTDVGIAGDCG